MPISAVIVTPSALRSGSGSIVIDANGTITVTGNIGFYAATPIARPAAYTQTYSAADKTHALVTQATPPAGGVGAAAGAYDTAANRDSMITSITNGAADLLDLKQLVNSVIDDLQSFGLLQ